MTKKDEYLNKKKIVDFLDKKGFYLVLIICIGVITLTAYVVTKRNLSSYMDITQIDNMPRLEKQEPKQNEKNVAVVSKPEVTEKKTADNITAKTETPKSIPEVQNNVFSISDVKMSWPITGLIKKTFADKTLVYFDTLQEWGTHEAVDITADRGLPVKASLDGTVSNIYTDPKYGITIEIDSDNGMKIKYSNLSSDSMVKKGEAVKKGDVISGIGNTALFESSEPAHLHFEVLQNNKYLDPMLFLKS